jgi:hypothetical protein
VGSFKDGAPGEIRTPDRSVRSPTLEIVSLYKSTACDLDQSQNVAINRINESYLVVCWYIIVTSVSTQRKAGPELSKISFDYK